MVNAVTPFNRGVIKDDPQSVVVIHQAEEEVAKVMFEVAREPIEAAGHIWDSSVITSYWQIEKMNTFIVSTFDCSLNSSRNLLLISIKKKAIEYVKEYKLIKVKVHKSHLLLYVPDPEGFVAAKSTPEMKEWDKANEYQDNVYSLELIQ